VYREFGLGVKVRGANVGGKNKLYAIALILYGCTTANFGKNVGRGGRLGNGFRRLPEPEEGKKQLEKKIDGGTDTR